MIKVLLADDERIIREGIGKLVKWEDFGTELTFLAKDGLEAYEYIKENQVDILITDIRMPKLSGLDLIEKVREANNKIKIIVVSGFDDFEYARKSLEYGVMEYIVKPYDVDLLNKSISKAVKSIKDNKESVEYLKKIESKLDKFAIHARKGIFKNLLLTSNEYALQREIEDYKSLIKIEINSGVLVCFEIENSKKFIEKFALENIIADVLEDNIYESVQLLDKIYCFISSDEIAREKIKNIQRIYKDLYGLEVTIGISSLGDLCKMNYLYNEVNNLLNYRFYLNSGSIITQEFSKISDNFIDEVHTREDIINKIKVGNREEVEKNLNYYFEKISGNNIDKIRNLSLRFYLEIINESYKELEYLEVVSNFFISDLDGIKEVIYDTSLEITNYNYNTNINYYSNTINEVIDYINENFGHPSLSLNYIAKNHVFLNTDYLGQLFQRETGEKFKNYLINLRVEKAKEIISNNKNLRVIDVCEEIGFGHNPQYFSQVFKKNTGVTIKEYMRWS